MSTPFTSASTATHLSNGCPSSTITPDANGHVPTGTCGYLSRPYYPSFAAALLFAFFAASVLLDFTLRVVRATRKRQWRRRREERGDCAKSGTTWVGWWYEEGMGPAWTGVILSMGLVVAYGVRAAGTKWQQVFWFVGVSDTIVLVWPVCMYSSLLFFARLDLYRYGFLSVFPCKVFFLAFRTRSRSLIFPTPSP
jgi:hypothetical protein